MGFRIEMKLDGLDAVITRMTAMGRKIPKTAGATLYAFANVIMTNAKQKYVPVAPDGGVLRASGVVEPPETNGNLVSVKMGFGDGPSAPYALAVHEHLSERSPRSWKAAEARTTVSGTGTSIHTTKAGGVRFNVQGTGPKYLERPFLEAIGGGKLEQQVASDIADGLERE